jgi:hypothetical protein
LLDYEAIFRDIDDRAAEDLLRTLRDALEHILGAKSVDLGEDGKPTDYGDPPPYSST